VRVIGGLFGGRTLAAPRGRSTRPTPERVREAVFSILADVSEATVLDLFAGSGAMGIEAMSRGARHVTLVDASPAAIAAIRSNVRALGIPAEVLHQRALAFLRNARTYGRLYDLVFLDPPYSQAAALGAELAGALTPVLAPGARVVVESGPRAPLELGLTSPSDERRYGDTRIEIFHLPDNDELQWPLTTE
jgi:16S rRNA (guanine966-N2)-methyltransferase